MTADRWSTIERLYHEALACPVEARATFLTVACPSDDALRHEVESLLAHDGDAAFLSTPAAAFGDASAIRIGQRLGSYVISGPLGEGGMGKVYRARDTKLGRDVAIKVLPQLFMTDPDRLARFDREARVLASLNHPHIGAIYGLDAIDGTPALILELVDGDTLAERLAKGALPVADALTIAGQMAEALEAAHERGIIHRDLKPANIKITPAGVVKVLDFGLAKAAASDASSPDLTQSPTITVGGTREGVILGTAAYMSPEQARGQGVDKRTDIWAFGCVLYEMLTGRAAFEGDTISDTIAAVLGREPDWRALPQQVPLPVRVLTERCLEKDFRQRIASMSIAQFLLAQHAKIAPGALPADARSTTFARAARRWERLAWVALVAIVMVVTAAIVWVHGRGSSTAAPSELRLEITTPSTTEPSVAGLGDEFSISPDGRRIVFVASGDGPSRLWLRPFDVATAVPLSGTEGATYPFWSPNGRTVAFFADSALKRVDVDGGRVQILARNLDGNGGTWGPDGIILFAPSSSGALFRVPATGGDMVAVTKLGDGQVRHRFPQFLPDGRQFLFRAQGEEHSSGIYIGSLDTSEIKRLTTADSAGRYAPPGWLLFVRQETLLAQRLDTARQALIGDPISVAAPMAVSFVSAGAFSVSDTGVITYRVAATPRRQLTWFDRAGHALGTIGTRDENVLLEPALSPDGHRVATRRTVQGSTNIWMLDSARLSRFTFDADGDQYALWSPDGSQIGFSHFHNSILDLYQKASSGAGSEVLLVESPQNKAAYSWSPDGRFLLYGSRDPNTGMDLWVLPMEGNGKLKPFVFLKSPFQERWAAFSPDGHWVAYQSDESGRNEIYVRPFPGPGGQWAISTLGGITPRWRADGKELYYIAPDGTLMAAPIIVKGSALEPGLPVVLFATRIVYRGASPVGPGRQYDVAPDGRFLINVSIDDEASARPITVILNWMEDLKQRVPTR